MTQFDFVMAGGGMSALSLAYQITATNPNATILIIDPEEKGENDRTWSFWSDGSLPHEELATASWDTIHFQSHQWAKDIPLGRLHYCMVRSVDFYEAVLTRLEDARVTFRREIVTEITDGEQSASVSTNSGVYTGTWVFDSRFDPQEYGGRSGPYHYLKQHFLGWTIETSSPCFDAKVATLFDFRVPNNDDFRFGYVLPTTPTRALIEYTLFTAELLEDHEYVHDLELYIRETLGISDYRVVDREKGVIPMTDEPAPRRRGARTLAIGTRGGMVKPSTGYAFARTQRDSLAIAESLKATGDPFHLPAVPRRFALLDTMMLQVMYRRGELSEQVFEQLFRRNPIERLLRFLDEDVTVPEMLAVMSTVPWGPFIKAFWRTKIKGVV